MKKSISMAMLLTFSCSLLSPPAHADYVQLRALREKGGTECTWGFNDKIREVHLESYFPIVGGNNAVLQASPEHVNDKGEVTHGVVMSVFMFNLRNVENVHFKNVHPGVNIEYDDNGHEKVIVNLAWSNLLNFGNNGKGLSLIARFDHAVKVRRIVIGGHELSSNGVGAMNIRLYDFKAYDADFKLIPDQYDLDVKVVDKDSDKLLENLLCTYQ
jgi:hypothetical protein